jgi:hypothetical protein
VRFTEFYLFGVYVAPRPLLVGQIRRVALGLLLHAAATAGFSIRKEKSRERLTVCWREMDSNFWYRGTKGVDFRSIPGIARVPAGLLNDTT